MGPFCLPGTIRHVLPGNGSRALTISESTGGYWKPTSGAKPNWRLADSSCGETTDALISFSERALPPTFCQEEGDYASVHTDTRTKGCEEKWLDRSHLEAIRKEALEHGKDRSKCCFTIDRGISEGVYSNLFIETSDGWSTPSLTTKQTTCLEWCQETSLDGVSALPEYPGRRTGYISR